MTPALRALSCFSISLSPSLPPLRHTRTQRQPGMFVCSRQQFGFQDLFDLRHVLFTAPYDRHRHRQLDLEHGRVQQHQRSKTCLP